MTIVPATAIYLLHALILPLLVMGLIRTARARIQGRTGPSLLQPFWDVAKLLRKGETISETATWAFRLGPLINLAAVLAVALMIPWLGLKTPIYGDLFLAIYLLALGKFCMSLSALDTGSSFGALGASREAAISVQSEPAMMIGLAALAARAHTSSFSAFLAPVDPNPQTIIPALLVTVALAIAAVAELARMPVDDPTTHLELTMVHEAMILENSGRNLAVVEFTVALRTVVLLGLVSQVFLTIFAPRTPLVSYVASLAAIVLAACAIAVAESVMVKLRWRRVPNLMSFAVGASVLACLFAALRG